MNFMLLAQLVGLASSVFNAASSASTTVQPVTDLGKEEREELAKFYAANPDATAADGHYHWVSIKEAQGWRRGDVFDAALKTHPSLVVFEELPLVLQNKNNITKQTVSQLINLLPLNIETKAAVSAVAETAEAVKGIVNRYNGGDA